LATSEQPTLPEQRRWSLRLMPHEVWASLAIGMIWLAVAFTAVFGPDMVFSNSNGTTRIPSAVVVALFAWLATRGVAKHGFDKPES